LGYRQQGWDGLSMEHRREVAIRRIEMANKIGWPALAQSWQETLRALNEQLHILEEPVTDNFEVKNEISSGMGSAFYPPPPEQRPANYSPLPADLSPREIDVLRLICDGGTRKTIGRSLGISPSTADAHVKSIHIKLGVHSNVQAAVLAVKAGLV